MSGKSLNKLTLTELRWECASVGLSTTGVKADLELRLSDFFIKNNFSPLNVKFYTNTLLANASFNKVNRNVKMPKPTDAGHPIRHRPSRDPRDPWNCDDARGSSSPPPNEKDTMKNKAVITSDLDDAFQVDDSKELGNPSNIVLNSSAVKTYSEQKHQSKNIPCRKNDVKVVENDEEKEVLLKEGSGVFAKTATPLRKKHAETSLKHRHLFNSKPGSKKNKKVIECKPKKKSKSATFLVLKTDVISQENPPLWRINRSLLQKYMPFSQDGRILYKNTQLYSSWNPDLRKNYYDAPILSLQQTKHKHIIQFLKSQEIQWKPKVEETIIIVKTESNELFIKTEKI